MNPLRNMSIFGKPEKLMIEDLILILDHKLTWVEMSDEARNALTIAHNALAMLRAH